jgi:hypothetical protein
VLCLGHCVVFGAIVAGGATHSGHWVETFGQTVDCGLIVAAGFRHGGHAVVRCGQRVST